MTSSHCAIEGTSFVCDGGGSGGGQAGALSVGFFTGGFLGPARGVGIGGVLVSTAAAVVFGGGGGGRPWTLGATWGFSLVN